MKFEIRLDEICPHVSRIRRNRRVHLNKFSPETFLPRLHPDNHRRRDFDRRSPRSSQRLSQWPYPGSTCTCRSLVKAPNGLAFGPNRRLRRHGENWSDNGMYIGWKCYSSARRRVHLHFIIRPAFTFPRTYIVLDIHNPKNTTCATHRSPQPLPRCRPLANNPSPKIKVTPTNSSSQWATAVSKPRPRLRV